MARRERGGRRRREESGRVVVRRLPRSVGRVARTTSPRPPVLDQGATSAETKTTLSGLADFSTGGAATEDLTADLAVPAAARAERATVCPRATASVTPRGAATRESAPGAEKPRAAEATAVRRRAARKAEHAASKS